MNNVDPRVRQGMAPAATILIRVLVGWVLVSEGIQKFLFPDTLGVGRFAKIGIPNPALTAPFVGAVEIVCGLLLLLGLWTRPATVPVLVSMTVAILTTKLPMLSAQGFWATAHESRTDFSMIFGLLFLLLAGAGPWSLDHRRDPFQPIQDTSAFACP